MYVVNGDIRGIWGIYLHLHRESQHLVWQNAAYHAISYLCLDQLWFQEIVLLRHRLSQTNNWARECRWSVGMAVRSQAPPARVQVWCCVTGA